MNSDDIPKYVSVAANDDLLGELRNRGYRLTWACKGYRGYIVQKILRMLNMD